MLKEKLEYLTEGVFLNYLPILIVILGSVVKVAFSLRLLIQPFLGKEPAAVGRHFHPPSLLFQAPPLLLAALSLAGGLLPGATAAALGAFSVPGLHAPAMPALKLWHGLTSPAFLISCGILAAGWVLYRLADLEGWRWAEIPRWLRFGAGFDWAVERLPVFGARVSRALAVEHPIYHGPVVMGVALAWIGLPFIAATGLVDWPAYRGAGLLPWLAALLLVAAGLCLLFARSWKAQVILIGSIGFLVTFYFVLYRAPDLALTQILVEVATLILLLLLMMRFPHLQAVPRRLNWRVGLPHALIAVAVGALMFGLTLLFTEPRPGPALGDAYLAASLPLAKGSNAVNTILVDFRGFDTLLEIGVLVIATLGILGLLLRRTERGPHV